MKRNIFVIGDLVIDHTVFVKIPKGSFQAAEGETVYKVVRRQDMAGGAANSARILAALNEGHTYLWGVIGGSHWGNFRTILDVSQLLDNTRSNLEFRGVQDETDAQMNTITRLIFVDGNGRMQRTIRFDDVDHVHVSDVKRETVMYHLEQVHDTKDPLEAIVINDLDKKCLTKPVVKQIADFAERNDIRLFVDPKRERDKYADIRGTAILPNLMEWCYLTEQPEKKYDYWRDNLENPDVLTEMANLSFRFLGNFKYHIITCDRLGSVIVAPHPKQRHLYAVYRARAAKAKNQLVEFPLGCGDLLTAVFAAEFDKKQEQKHGTRMALTAYHRANTAVGCYCDMSWHRMPSLAMVQKAQEASPTWNPRPVAEPSIGMLYLPRTPNIVLSEFAKVLPRVYSNDKKFNSELQRLVDEIGAQTQKVTPKSIMLGAPSGAGKSRVIEGLLEELPRRRIPVQLIEKSELVDLVKGANSLTLVKLLKRLKQPSIALGQCFMIVDEAYGNHFGQKRMLDVLLTAHMKGVRFVFVDSLFHSENSGKTQIMPDILTRCTPVELSGISDRPGDIPYLIADKLLHCGERDGIHVIRVEAKFLLSITDRILEDGHPRRQLNSLNIPFDNAKKAAQPGLHFLIGIEHLPEKHRPSQRSSVPLSPDVFTLSR